MIRVFFRYDDYSAISPAAVDRGLIEILRRARASCTFGVIPSVATGVQHDPADGEELTLSNSRIELLREAVQAGAVEAAVHGWSHRTHGGALPPHPSEFAGLPLEAQIVRLQRACDSLEQMLDRRPQTFIPPWNSYDRNTLTAMEAVGLQIISANREGPDRKAGGVRFVPITIEIAALPAALSAARSSTDIDPVIGVMVHPYDFHESNDPRSSISLEDFERHLASLLSSHDVAVCSIENLAQTSMTSRRYAANRSSPIERVYPPRIPSAVANPLYLSEHAARPLRWRRNAQAMAFHLGAALIGYAAAVILMITLQTLDVQVGIAIPAVTAAALALLVARSVARRSIYFRGAVVASNLAGVLAGLVI